MSYIQKEIKDSVLIISLDAPWGKVNTLNEAMMEQFSSLLKEADSDSTLKGIVLISRKEDNFIAGADIEMFKARSTAQEMQQLSWDGHQVLSKIATSKKPSLLPSMLVVWAAI